MSMLDSLAVKYGTDKGTGHHGYTDLYDWYFAPIRYFPFKLLEIGVGSGASLRMWEEFFPNANIYGIDINADCKEHETERIKIFIGHQADKKFLDEVLGEIGSPDIVIDDGSHRPQHQVASMRKIFPHVQHGGTYAIEDIYKSLKARGGGAVQYFKDLVDGIQHGDNDIKSIHFYYNIVLIFKNDR
jgi:hypothetical protein